MTALFKTNEAGERGAIARTTAKARDGFLAFWERAYPPRKLENEVKRDLDRHNYERLIKHGPENEVGRAAHLWLVERARNSPRDKKSQLAIVTYLKVACAFYPELLDASFGGIGVGNPLRGIADRARVELGRYWGDLAQFREDGRSDDLLIYALGQNGNNHFVQVATRDIMRGNWGEEDLMKILDGKKHEAVAGMVVKEVALSGKIGLVEKVLGRALEDHPFKNAIIGQLTESMMVVEEKRDTGGSSPGLTGIRIFSLKDAYGDNVNAATIQGEIDGVKSKVRELRELVEGIQLDYVANGGLTSGIKKNCAAILDMARSERESLFFRRELLVALREIALTTREVHSNFMTLYTEDVSIGGPKIFCDAYAEKIGAMYSSVREFSETIGNKDEEAFFRYALEEPELRFHATVRLATLEKPDAKKLEHIINLPEVSEPIARMAVVGLVNSGDFISMLGIVEDASAKGHPRLEAMIDQFSKAMTELKENTKRAHLTGMTLELVGFESITLKEKYGGKMTVGQLVEELKTGIARKNPALALRDRGISDELLSIAVVRLWENNDLNETIRVLRQMETDGHPKLENAIRELFGTCSLLINGRIVPLRDIAEHEDLNGVVGVLAYVKTVNNRPFN